MKDNEEMSMCQTTFLELKNIDMWNIFFENSIFY